MKLSKEQEVLVSDLFNSDEETVISTLTILEEKGNEHCIEPLLEVLSSEQSELVKEKTAALLQEMKNTKAMATFLELYLDKRFLPAANYTLQVVWNANLDASAHLEDIVRLATTGNLQTCLEAATVIDSLPGPFDEAHVLEGIILCKTCLEDDKTEDAKRPFINDILSVLEQINLEQ